MASERIDEILATIRTLPVPDRLRVAERIVHEVAEATPGSPPENRVGPLRIDPRTGLPVFSGSVTGSLHREDIYEDVG